MKKIIIVMIIFIQSYYPIHAKIIKDRRAVHHIWMNGKIISIKQDGTNLVAFIRNGPFFYMCTVKKVSKTKDLLVSHCIDDIKQN